MPLFVFTTPHSSLTTLSVSLFPPPRLPFSASQHRPQGVSNVFPRPLCFFSAPGTKHNTDHCLSVLMAVSGPYTASYFLPSLLFSAPPQQMLPPLTTIILSPFVHRREWQTADEASERKRRWWETFRIDEMRQWNLYLRCFRMRWILQLRNHSFAITTLLPRSWSEMALVFTLF